MYNQRLRRPLKIALLAMMFATASVCAAQDWSPGPGPMAAGMPSDIALPSQQAIDGGQLNLDGRVAPPPGPVLPDDAAAPPLPPLDLTEKASEAPGFGDGGFGGRGGMGGFGGGMRPVDSLRFSSTWFPTVPVHGQAADFQMLSQNLTLTHPLWTDPLSSLSLMTGLRSTLLTTDALLPDTGQAIPSELWNIHMGLNYTRRLDDGWVTGGGFSIGSASDRPFASIREMNVGVNAMLRIPQGEHNAWQLALMYSPTSELNFPIPGVAFNWNPSPQFHAMVGLPMSITWRPTDDWQIEASYMLIHTIRVKTLYRIAPRMSLFAAFDGSNEAYSLVDRPEHNDRFFIYDERVSMGLQTAFWDGWTASFAGGCVFDRYLYEGTSFAKTSSNRVDLGTGPFMSLNLGARF